MLTHLENCLRFKYVAVDTEGWQPDLLGLSIAHPGLESMYFPLGHREDVNVDEEVREAIQFTLKTVTYRIMHHAGHDIVALPYISELPFVCTMIMGHMVDESMMSKSLDFMHKSYCGGEGKKMPDLMAQIIKTMGWYCVPFELMNVYASEDALITMELFQKLLPLYEEQFGPLWSES
jgi:DNA polymerase I-like protein with 3'-5' exonuclease and polymerase domains